MMHPIKVKHLATALLVMSMITPGSATGKFSFKKITCMLGGQPYKAIIEKEYTTPRGGILNLSNINGNIQINTDEKQKKIKLTATKRANQEEQLSEIELKVKQSNRQLTIKSAYLPEKSSNTAIDYVITMPENIKLRVTALNGSITADTLSSPAVLTAHNGSVTVDKTADSVRVQTKEYGNIQIKEALGNVQAITDSGSIQLNQTNKSVIAHTKKGNVNVACLRVPTTSTIDVHTDNGTVNLALPTSTNATVQGKTERGTITSEHYVTLKEQVTQLNSAAWSRFKKEVNGTLGSGEAVVKLSSLYGNVKIAQTKTT